MPGPLTLNLDDIVISPDEADKPAGSPDPTPAPAPTEPPVTPPADATPAAPAAPAPAPTTPPAADPLTPFHEHPDWKKMQAEKVAAEERATAAEEKLRQAEAARTPAPAPAPTPSEYDGMTRPQIIEKIMLKKTESGWKPKDQLEYDVAIEEAKDKAAEIVSSQTSQSQARFAEQIESKFLELGVTEPAERKLVTDTMLAWAKQGMNVSLATFNIAVENLKLRGEIGKPQAPAQPVTPAAAPVAPAPAAPTTPDPAAAARASQDAANRRLGKPASGGGEAKSEKPSFKYLRNTDLDTIILDQGAKIDPGAR